ncbi:hypothetical protein F4778DRAFT_364814 [Xylariomycetidae sp. FL2044]|nr:hypothetical protein F4778DRAFT_364814 [Xylariomycetidae sp. FL2044]
MAESVLAKLNLDFGALFLLAVTMCAFLVPVVLILPPVPLQASDALLQTHSRAGVGRGKSRLAKQHSAADHAPPEGDEPPPRVQSLVIYPVKSCRGIEVTRSRVLPAGLQFDRLFTFAQLKSTFPVAAATVNDKDDNAVEEGGGDDEKTRDEQTHTWEFITQRQFPRLATVKVDLWLPDEMKLRKQSLKSQEAFVILRFPWREEGRWRGLLSVIAAKLSRGRRAVPEREVLLPADFPPAEEIAARGYAYEDVRIWRDTAAALNMSRELPEELRRYLGVSNKLALFRVDPARLREVYRCAPRREEAGYQPVTGFQDAYPLHLMNLNSLQAFSSEVPKDEELKQLDVMRFRPNIILSGAPAYDEESWKQVRFKPGDSGLYNDAVFHVSCRTVRCKLPNVDPTNGIRHPVEPDKSLRANRAVDPGAPRMGCLGMQMTPLFDGDDDDEACQGWVAVGMKVEVEQRGEHVYIKQ